MYYLYSITMERKLIVVLCVMPLMATSTGVGDIQDPLVCNDMHLLEFRDIEEVTR